MLFRQTFNIQISITGKLMRMFLFKVDAVFTITGIGVALTPGIGDGKARVGDTIKLIRPDKTILETKIKAVAFESRRSIVVGSNIKKEDVPVGTEVWLIV